MIFDYEYRISNKLITVTYINTRNNHHIYKYQKSNNGKKLY